jgi:hypothetical protein
MCILKDNSNPRLISRYSCPQVQPPQIPSSPETISTYSASSSYYPHSKSHEPPPGYPPNVDPQTPQLLSASVYANILIVYNHLVVQKEKLNI